MNHVFCFHSPEDAEQVHADDCFSNSFTFEMPGHGFARHEPAMEGRQNSLPYSSILQCDIMKQ